MGSKKRRRLDGLTKIGALEKHVMGKKAVSEICQELEVQPSMFYGWQRELFARGSSVFDTKPGIRKVDRTQEKIAELEARLAKKDAVIAELLEEHVALKKSLGGK